MNMEDEIRALREALHKVESERDHYKDLAADLEAKNEWLADYSSQLEDEVCNLEDDLDALESVIDGD